MNHTDPKMIEILEYPDDRVPADAKGIAGVISLVGLILALLGLGGLLHPSLYPENMMVSLALCWAFAFFGTCTALMGLALRHSCAD